jgi:hypothetical protein
MAAKSFIEILEQEIRKDLREEIETQVRKEMQAEKRQAPHAYSYASEQDSGHTPESKVAEGLETWLAANVEKIFFPRAQAARHSYKSSAPKSSASKSSAAKPSQPTSSTSMTPDLGTSSVQRRSAKTFEAACAFELLKRHSGVGMPEAFSMMELKGAWRKAALKSHPDRFAQSDQVTQARAAALFRELASAFEILENLFVNANEEAA